MFFQTPANDLQSLLALKLKRKMLYSLFDKDLYNDNPTKQEEVYNKYKHYLDSVSNFNYNLGKYIYIRRICILQNEKCKG